MRSTGLSVRPGAGSEMAAAKLSMPICIIPAPTPVLYWMMHMRFRHMFVTICSRLLAFALRDALDGGCFQHLALLAATRMVGVGEFEQFDGCAVFDDERDADAVG